jgi:hypothetical protein
VRRAFWREYLRFFIFPLGGTTDFLGRFFKSIFNAIYVSKKYFFSDIAKIKTNQKNNRNTFMLRKWLQLAVYDWFGPKISRRNTQLTFRNLNV